MAGSDERRKGERRSGLDRRHAPRMGSPERRLRERRGRGAMRAGALLATLALTGSEAEGQIYTRRNDRGVMEATNAPAESDFRLAYPGKGTLIHSRGWQPRYNGEFDADIVAAAAQHGVAADLVKAVMQVESDFDHLAVSSKGAQGLMQLMPDTARRMGVSDPFDARQNIFGGVRYLRILLDMFGGDTRLALAAYNAGATAVQRYGGVPPYRETRNYLLRIQRLLGAPFSLPAAFFTPGAPPARASAGPAVGERSGRKPARPKPRVYYRWKDTEGVLHVGEIPPPDGTSFTLIRGAR